MDSRQSLIRPPEVSARLCFNKACNVACRAELGRFPLNITINQKILKYILYIQSKDEESLVKQAFLMSFDLHCNGKNSFHSHLMNMSEYFKLPDFNPDLLDIAMVESYVSSMKQEYISYCQNTLQHSQKLECYRSFKTDSYLDFCFIKTRGTAGRKGLVKLRISNHKLMIKIGRYNQTTMTNRHCPFSECNVIEDEVHVLHEQILL